MKTTKRTIKPVAVLDYYDGIQLFEGRDPIGGHYIAVLLASLGKAEHFLVTGAKPERLQQFRAGVLDLRTLLLDAPGGEWFFIYADVPYGEPLTLIPQEGDLTEREDLLPGEGYTLDDAPIDDLSEKRAIESNNTVFEFKLAPPESAYDHRVRADTLSAILAQTQLMVKHAYRSALSERKHRGAANNTAADGYLMDVVVPAAPGSFRVILEAAVPLDDPIRHPMFAPGDLTIALKRMDEVFQSAEEPDMAQEIMQRHKGDLADAYIKLLGILAEKNTGFHYSWADPHLPRAQYGGVSAGVAKTLYDALAEGGAKAEGHAPNG